jgi:hypothetical protein
VVAQCPLLGSLSSSNNTTPMFDKTRQELDTPLYIDGALPSLPPPPDPTWWELDMPQQPAEPGDVEGSVTGM